MGDAILLGLARRVLLYMLEECVMDLDRRLPGRKEIGTASWPEKMRCLLSCRVSGLDFLFFFFYWFGLDITC